MSTQLIQWLADGAPGSHPGAHQLFFANQSELFGEILSAKALGRIVGKCDKSIRIAPENTMKTDSVQANTQPQFHSMYKRTLPLLRNGDGTTPRVTKELDPTISEEDIFLAFISSPHSRRQGRPVSKAGDNG